MCSTHSVSRVLTDKQVRVCALWESMGSVSRVLTGKQVLDEAGVVLYGSLRAVFRALSS